MWGNWTALKDLKRSSKRLGKNRFIVADAGVLLTSVLFRKHAAGKDFTALALPAAPSGLVANVSKNRVDLTWVDNATNEEGYTVERRKETDTQWQTIGTVAADVRTFSDTQFARRTDYVYRVRAFNASEMKKILSTLP